MQDYQPRSKNQLAAIQSIDSNIYTFLIGNPGCGKTFLSLFKAVQYFKAGKVGRIIIIRPCIEANFGEKLGSFPGTLIEKMSVHLGGIYDNLINFLTPQEIGAMIEREQIRLVPLSVIRGSSFNNAFIICDEAQNISLGGIYTIMSRIGLKSKLVINGDPNQCDIPNKSDLLLSIEKLRTPHLLDNIGIVELFAKEDIQRNPMLFQIMRRFGIK